MISSGKILAFMLIAQALLVLLPSILLVAGAECLVFIPSTDQIPVAIAGSLSYLSGMALWHMLFPFKLEFNAVIDQPRMFRLYLLMLAGALAVSLWLLLAGLPPVLWRLMEGASSLELVQAREEAIKLNPNPLQVRALVLSRDVLAPVLIVIGVSAWSTRPRFRPLFAAGIAVAGLVLLWSGQKAPLLHACLALLLWRGGSHRLLTQRNLLAAIGFAVMLLAVFSASQPDLYLRHPLLALKALVLGIHERIFATPLAVSMTYLFAADSLHVVGWRDAIPYYQWLWRPTFQPIEATIGQSFYHGGYATTVSGGLAFAYTYVIGGLPACLGLGFVTPWLIRISLRIVSWSGRPELVACFAAYLCYLLVDTLQGNSLQYLIGNLVFAILVAPLGFLLPRPDDAALAIERPVGPFCRTQGD